MIWIIVGQLLWAIIATLGCIASYRNGVNDGYGFSREPNNPGYQKAGRYLRKYAAHRWPELNRDRGERRSVDDFKNSKDAERLTEKLAAQPSEAAGVLAPSCALNDGHCEYPFHEVRLCTKHFRSNLLAQPLTLNAGEVRLALGPWLKRWQFRIPAECIVELNAALAAGPTVPSAEYHRGAKEAFQRVVDEWKKDLTRDKVQSWANNCAVYEQQHRLEAAGAAKEAGGEGQCTCERKSEPERYCPIHGAWKAAAPNRETELRALKVKMDKMCSFLPAGHSFCMLRDELAGILAPDKPQPPSEGNSPTTS